MSDPYGRVSGLDKRRLFKVVATTVSYVVAEDAGDVKEIFDGEPHIFKEDRRSLFVAEVGPSSEVVVSWLDCAPYGHGPEHTVAAWLRHIKALDASGGGA